MKPQSNSSILIIDDDPVVARHIDSILKKNSYLNTALFSTGEEALAFLKTDKPALAIIDITLGGELTGIETAHAVNKEYHLPYVFITSDKDEELMKRALKAGPYGYVTKPFGGGALLTAVELALGRFSLEEEHRRSKNTIESLLDASPDPILLLDRKASVIVGNKRAAGNLGFTPEDLQGKILWDFFPPEVAEIRKEHFEKVIKDRAPQIFQDTRAGLHFEMRMFPVYGRDGEVESVALYARDITKIKNAIDALYKESEFRNYLLNSSPAFYVALDRKGCILMMNDVLLETVEYKKEEVLGKDYLSFFVDEKERKTVREMFGRLTRGERTVNVSTLRSKGGEEYTVEWHGTPAFTREGDVDFYFGMGLDITEKEAALNKLMESEEKFRLLFEQTEDAQLLIREGVFADCNEAALRLLKIKTKSGIVGQCPHEVSPGLQPDGRDSEEKAREMIACAKKRGNYSFEWLHRRPNGELFYADVTLTSMKIQGEEMLHTAWRDMTDKKMAELALIESEKKLKQSEELYRGIFETAGTAMAIIDPRFSIMLVNNRMEVLTGLSFSELKNLDTVFSLFAEGDMMKARNVFESSRLRTDGMDDLMVKNDLTGHFRECIVIVSFLIETGSYVVSFIDMSKERTLEREILNISIQEQHRIGQDLHDGLGQHLTGIAFMGKVLEKRLHTLGLPERESAAKITSLVNEAVEQTRSFARGLCPVMLESEKLENSFQSYADDIHILYGITCSVNFIGDIKIEDDSAAAQLFNIVKEAINNSIRHGKAKRVEIKMMKVHNRFVLEVTDDGTGLSEGYEEKKGIGIKIMEIRARRIGASLIMKNNEDRGATVRVLYEPGVI